MLLGTTHAGNDWHVMRFFFSGSALWPWSWCCERQNIATLKFGVQGAGSCQRLQYFFLYQYSAKGQTTMRFGVQGAGSSERKIRNAHHSPTLHCKVWLKILSALHRPRRPAISPRLIPRFRHIMIRRNSVASTHLYTMSARLVCSTVWSLRWRTVQA